MIPKEGIYTGFIVHERMRPKKHRLRYRVFSLLVDIDNLNNLSNQLRMISHNKFSYFSIKDSDHGDRGNIRKWINEELSNAGLDHSSHRVFMLCYPRILGYVFNPITVFFCYGEDGEIGAVIYEVHNTFGGRHNYVLEVSKNDKLIIRQNCDKILHVSPFIEMECRYKFFVEPPEQNVRVVIREEDREGLLLAAALVGNFQPITDVNLMKAALKYPLMTIKVIFGIHIEALRLLIKGVPFLGASPRRRHISGNSSN